MSMKNLVFAVGLFVALTGCARKEPLDLPTGSDVTVQKRDGVSVSGRLVEVKAEQIVLESRDGVKTMVPRADITSMRTSSAVPATRDVTPEATRQPESTPQPVSTTGAAGPEAVAPPPVPSEPRRPEPKPVEAKPEYREVTLAAGTVLPVALGARVDSDRSHVEDPVRGTLRRAVMHDGLEALPAGTVLLGHVTSVQRAGKVKGRASIAVRFNRIDLPGAGGPQPITTAAVSRLAPATKQKDASRIGVGAGAGAVVGGLLGGKSGAAKGAAVGGGAGTAVVLSTRGNEIGMAAGAPLSVRLTAPLTIHLQAK
jgi:predicted small lipoprotein YifL